MIIVAIGNIKLSDKIKNATDNTNRVFFDESQTLDQFLRESISSVSLFGDVYTFTVQGIATEEFINSFSKYKNEFSGIKNNFIFYIPSLTKKVEDVCKGIDVVFVKDESKKEKEFPKVFNLADAYINHDKKKAYAIFCEIINEGGTPEEILGTLIWQLKQILNIYNIQKNKLSPDDFGMKPYTFSKTKSALLKKENTEENILNDYKELVLIYHRGHNGIISIQNGLEKFILERV